MNVASDNDVNPLSRDKAVAQLRQQLFKATSHIKQLASDKRVLIEVGNRLRAELLRNGNWMAAVADLLYGCCWAFFCFQ